MSRKTQMSMWKDGHRRSPRISALDAWKAHKEKDGGVNVSQNSIQVMPMEHNGLGPPSRTRARKKRKLRPVQDVAVSSVTTTANQESKSPVDEDHPINSDQLSVFQAKGQSSIVSSSEWLPEKHILELILDTLQRRDTHEIFAEPVDPEEVEDYYEIIKEPMDFGTMRAKLHEGMYKNLEQFEHDVFLISSNAMHFNSSATIYFRQARALQELSKKVFHVLKTDPRNFELEFSASRRRPGRRPQGDARGSNFSSPPKPMTNVRSRSMAYDGSSKGTRSSSGSSSLRRTIRVNPGCSDTATHFETGDPEILSGSGDGRRSNFSETEQRCAYRASTSFLDESELIVSTTYSKPKPLLHVNQCDIGYTESLMMFVKDLGLVAQMVAKKKLQGWWPNEPNRPTPSSNHWFQAPKCENPAAGILDIKNATRSEYPLYHIQGPATHVLKSSSGGIHLTVADEGVRADRDVTMANSGTGGEVAPNGGAKITCNGGRGKDHSSNRVNFPAVLGGNMVHQNQSTEIQLASYSSTCAGDLNPSFDRTMNTGSKSRPILVDTGKLDHQVQPLVLSSEPSQSNMFEKFTLKTVNTLAPPSWPLQTKETPASSHTIGSLHDSGLQYISNEDPATAAPTPKFTSSAQAGLVSGLNQPKPLVSQFIFDLPFLRSQLSQMNSSGQAGMQRGSTAEGHFSDKRSYDRASMRAHRAEPSPQPSHSSQQRSLLDSKPTDLALQL
ncbi:uncharacterized protein LOC104879961 isoform X2 [Vitis vinifera]|uniref:uncharacterized protein LOC104879961 isoform X2 n=1 Tax=Vitis vinifera TaxID=29760 RepID=UPI00053FE3A2|nr:uncharacterized protein LOC104879961 isoform X2 [Vitis vinifera]|eukprot:XP_010653116.1 PREDICTED: uncharacterized protein LOC104879961 isoform X2 [Vitis vinifera]